MLLLALLAAGGVRCLLLLTLMLLLVLPPVYLLLRNADDLAAVVLLSLPLACVVGLCGLCATSAPGPRDGRPKTSSGDAQGSGTGDEQ